MTSLWLTLKTWLESPRHSERDWTVHVTEFQLKSDNAVYWAGMPRRPGRAEQGTLPEILKDISRLNFAAL